MEGNRVSGQGYADLRPDRAVTTCHLTRTTPLRSSAAATRPGRPRGRDSARREVLEERRRAPGATTSMRVGDLRQRRCHRARERARLRPNSFAVRHVRTPAQSAGSTRSDASANGRSVSMRRAVRRVARASPPRRRRPPPRPTGRDPGRSRLRPDVEHDAAATLAKKMKGRSAGSDSSPPRFAAADPGEVRDLRLRAGGGR